MNKDIEKVLIRKRKILKRVKALAKTINNDYAGKDILVVGVLRGAVVFLSDLFRNLKLNATLDFMEISSYGSEAVSSGKITVRKDVTEQVENRHVLIIEDIIESGNTLKYLKELFTARNALSVKTCVLLDKNKSRKVELNPDYIGFNIPDDFVVGYGLDYDEKYRNLPDICVLNQSVYAK